MIEIKFGSSHILCDRDPIFTSKVLEEILEISGTKQNISSTYHPQMYVQIKVVNKSLGIYLRCLQDKRHQLVKWLPLAAWCYNKAYNLSTKISLFKALYGQNFHPSFTIYQKNHETKTRSNTNSKRKYLPGINRMKQEKDQHHLERKFEVGDMLSLRLQLL